MCDKKQNENGTATLIIGPSCSGKSTYLMAKHENVSRILMAYELDNSEESLPLSNQIVIHYNSLRPYKNSHKKLHTPIQSEKVLAKILNSNLTLRVYLLVASKKNLLQRARKRQFIEPDIKQNYQSYCNKKVVKLFKKIDLYSHYSDYLNLCKEYEIEVSIVDSNNEYRYLQATHTQLKESLQIGRDRSSFWNKTLDIWDTLRHAIRIYPLIFS